MGADPTTITEAALTRSLVAAVSLRYPGRFDDSQVEAMRRALEPIVKQMSVLRQYRLTNADEPDPIFRPYRGEG